MAEAVRSCTRCGLSGSRANGVPGEGSPTASIMFIGEAPGATEDEQGRPFVGRAGQLLDELLGVVPLRRADVYITNVVKSRPPGNRDPLPEEVSACWPFLEAQIALINPRVIATLGRHALNRFFPDARISRDHGRILRWRHLVVMPLYHPAAALRSTQVRQTLEEDMLKLPRAVIESLRLQSAPGRPATPDDDRTPPEAGPSGENPSTGAESQIQLKFF